MASVRKRKWTHKGVDKEAWVVAYTDQGGKRRLKTFDKKKDADRERARIEVEIEKGVHVPDRETRTVAQICELYFQHCQQRHKDGRLGTGSLFNIQNAIMTSIVPYLGNVMATALTPKQVEEWFYKITSEGQLRTITAKGRIARLAHIQDWAIKQGWMVKRPVSEAQSELRGMKIDKVRTFTAEEVARILVMCLERRPMVRARSTALLGCFVHLAALCGLRLGEIMGLTRKAIDLEKGVIHVWHSLTPFDELKAPKTNAGIRDVPMPRHVVEMLDRWLASPSFCIEDDRGLIFRSAVGTHYDARTFHQYQWKPLLTRAGLAPAEGTDWHHFYALRHFAASWMIEHNLPITEVAALLGHAKVSTTMDTYGRVVANPHRRTVLFQEMSHNLLTVDATPARHEPATT